MHSCFQYLVEKLEGLSSLRAIYLICSFFLLFLVIYLYIREHTSKCSGLASSGLLIDFKYFNSFVIHAVLVSLYSTSKTWGSWSHQVLKLSGKRAPKLNGDSDNTTMYHCNGNTIWAMAVMVTIIIDYNIGLQS